MVLALIGGAVRATELGNVHLEKKEIVFIKQRVLRRGRDAKEPSRDAVRSLAHAYRVGRLLKAL